MTDFYEPLKAHLLLRVPFTEEECTEILSRFHLKRIKKKQFILQPEFVAKFRNFVVEGALRGFVVDEEGIERTIQFAVKDWWITDYNSYIFQQPGTMFVEALEDSVILQIDYESEKWLKNAHHKYETLFRIMAERSTAYIQRRIISTLTQSAEERYLDFVERYGAVTQNIPQYAIASYLGMTTEFLSKIRNNRLKKKS
jgi:CRP-like cAMP-binding protein